MNFAVQNIPNILDIVFKGLLIGIIASAPMGPVGILCVQRTLNKGRWYGFVTGCGAAVSDMIYAGITGLGMGLVVDFVSNDTNRFYLALGFREFEVFPMLWDEANPCQVYVMSLR